MSEQVINIVIRGLGAAGTARHRAVAESPHFRLAGIISRRPEHATMDWEQSLASSAVDAVAVSTENTDHETAVEQALSSGKHVLCDFPLAFTAGRARKLFSLAGSQNLVLHAEHIGLLTKDHAALKAQAKTLGSLRKGDYVFQGGWNDKLFDPAWTGPQQILSLPRLLQVADIFGPFVIESHRVKWTGRGYTLHMHLNFLGGGTLGYTEERVEGLARRRTLLADCRGGSLGWKAHSGDRGLFARDLHWFRDRIVEGKPCYYDEELMIQIIGELQRVTLPPPPSTVSEK